MKILLCLLSDQHVPNLLSVHHCMPDQLVLIESTRMQKRETAKYFLRALKLGNLDYDTRHHIEPLNAEDNLASVRQVLQRAYGKFSTGEWVANLTGGTKPMSIATYEFFKALGGKLIYTNFEWPARLIDMSTGQVEDCTHRLGIKEFVAGYGFEPKKSDQKLEEAEARASGWADSANVLARHALEKDILDLNPRELRVRAGQGNRVTGQSFCVSLRRTEQGLAKRCIHSKTVQI